MKKTLLASAILAGLVSVSAQAATIYDQEGTTVEVSGSAEVAAFFNTSGSAVSDSSGSIGISGESKVSDSVTAYAEFSIESDADSAVTTDDLLVGFDTAYGDFSMGATDAALDQITDFTDIGDEFGGIQGIAGGDGDTGFFYTNSFGGVVVNAEYIASDVQDADSMGVSVAYYTESGLGFGLGYVTVEDATDDADEIAVGVGYTAGDLYVGLGYAIVSQGDEDITSIELAAKYQATSDLSVAVLTGQAELDDGTTTSDEEGYFAVELGYSVNDSVYTYVGYQTSTLDESDANYNDDQIKASVEYSF